MVLDNDRDDILCILAHFGHFFIGKLALKEPFSTTSSGRRGGGVHVTNDNDDDKAVTTMTTTRTLAVGLTPFGRSVS